jgi:hypothetical protein
VRSEIARKVSEREIIIMKNYKVLVSTALSLTLFFCVAAQSECKSEKNKEQVNKKTDMNKNVSDKKMPDEMVSKPDNSELKTIAEGSYSKPEKPFIFVARSPETYAQLQNLAENLPSAAEIDFGKTAVVAAFAGTKNTGGYSVVIKKTAGKIVIDVAAPPKDAMTTQALTTPFKAVLISIEEDNTLPLDVSGTLAAAVETYKTTSGEFEYSGGFAGIQKKFEAEGTIGILSYGDYITLVFNLSGKDVEKARKLIETASGVIKNGKIEIARLDAGSFSENPKPPLKVSGTMENGKLSLTFEPLPTMIADGYQVRGKIEAARVK